ncbi:hypothetical protein [Wukongibacter sp. M2B1]|uniref:hypothetical protein n=1 Tax=Wukongibacter sp. M2B1 TaxID=3088895 RepID=UPI003D7955AE
MKTKALYYPSIDIDNDRWLKSTLLYWDEINTIVPYSLKKFYYNETAMKLADLGVLRPYKMFPNSTVAKKTAIDFVNYLSTAEGKSILINNNRGTENNTLKRLMNEAHLHPEKMTYEVKRYLEEFIPYNEDGFFETPKLLSDYYMTVLANNIANNNGFEVITDKNLLNDVSVKLKTGVNNKKGIICPYCQSPNSNFEYRRRDRYRCLNCGERIPTYFNNNIAELDVTNISEGLLADIIVDKFYIGSDVEIERILEFKDYYKSELLNLRNGVNELSSSLQCTNIESLKSLKEQLHNIYTHKIEHEVRYLEEKLNKSGINYIKDDMRISSIITAVAFIPLLSNSPIYGGLALAAIGGLSLATSRILINDANKKLLEENQYSYVLRAKSEL